MSTIFYCYWLVIATCFIKPYISRPVHALVTSEKVISTNHFCYKRPDSAQLVAANPICSSTVWRAGESQWPVQCWAGLGWAGGYKLVQVQLRHRRGEVATVASNHQQLPGEHRHLARAEPHPRHHGQVLRREVLEREEAVQVRAGHLLQQAGPADLPLAHGPRSGEQTNRLEPFLSFESCVNYIMTFSSR